MAHYCGWHIDALHDGCGWEWNDKSRDGFQIEISNSDVFWSLRDSRDRIKRLKELDVISDSADENTLFVDDDCDDGNTIEICRLDEDYRPVYALIRE